MTPHPRSYDLQDGIRIRAATPEDNTRICTFLASVTMGTGLGLAELRDPAPGSLYDMQGNTWECWLGENVAGELLGISTMMVRDAYLGGERCRVGYLGDLRLKSGRHETDLLHHMYGTALDDFSQRHDVDIWHTAMIASNNVVINSVTGEHAVDRGIPPHHLSARFHIRAVQFMFRKKGREHQFTTATATEADIPELSEHLDRDARQRPYGYPFDDGLLEERLNTWPGLHPESFVVARDPQGRITGCIAPWDARPVRVTQVTHYHGRMRAMRAGYNIAARFGGFQKLPAPGNPVPCLYGTHLAVPDDDPHVLAALLDHVYERHQGGRFAFMACCAVPGDGLDLAYRKFSVHNLPANLYTVTAPGTDAPDGALTMLRPGCEMALI